MIATRFAIQSAEHAPAAWFVFAAYRPQWAAAWFEENAVEAWYPTVTRWEERMAQGRKKRVQVTRPAVGGLVWAAFRGVPMWHIIKERASPKIGRVLCVAGQPRRFTDAEMMQMTSVPHRLEAMRKEEEARKRINPGDTVRHPTFGKCIVTGIDATHARILAPLFGDVREVQADMVALEKII
jgi:hypothetical protein